MAVPMENNSIAPWKLYSIAITEAALSFCLTTFSLGIYLTHSGHWTLTILMVLLYLTCFAISIYRIVTKFSMAALMLLIPITPLLILLSIIALIPLLEKLQ